MNFNASAALKADSEEEIAGFDSLENPALIRGLGPASKVVRTIEAFIGQRITGIVIGFLLLCIAAIYVTPSFELVNNGWSFAQLSSNPYARASNMFGNRILSPYIAYLLHLRGPKFIYFPLLTTIVLLGAIFAHFRRQGHPPIAAIAASSTVAFSSPVLFLLHFQGYTDVLTHLLVFWCYVLRKSRFIWIFPLALSCLNHEATLFSIPWIVFLRTRYTGVPFFSFRGVLYQILDLVLVVLAILPMFLMKELWPLQDTSLSPQYYLSLIGKNWMFIFRYAGFGIFEAFKIFWCLPMLALLAAPRGTRISLSIALMLMCAAGVGQLLISHDTSRHVGHAFPMLLYSLEIILRRRDWRNRVEEWLVILVLVNFLVPQYYVGQQNIWPFLPSPVSYILWLFGFNPWNLPFAPWT